jgi:hypothetical protein
MKNLLRLIGSLTLTVLAVAGIAQAQDESALVMTGTETPESHTSGESGECFVFAKYVIKTSPSEDAGANISVYKRVPAAENPCDTSGNALLYVADSDNNSFFGLSGKYMFVDMGTSADSHSFDIYDFSLHKSVLSQGYMGDPKLVSGRFLVFDSPSDKKGLISTCKEAAKWKRQGGGVGWVQGKKLDLQTLTAVNVGTLRCVYLE